MSANLPASRPEVARFLAAAKSAGPSAGGRRLLFALDATASREPTWDMAMELHAELFRAASEADDAALVQLAYYRGFGEFVASPWSSTPAELLGRMTGVACRGGRTQIGRLLKHALAECQRQRVHALVFVGDACEESARGLTDCAGQLALFRLPVFVLQEGDDPNAAAAFSAIAKVTGGAHIPFAPGSVERLRALFRIVARYAAKGRDGLRHAADTSVLESGLVRDVLAQLPP